MGRPEDYHLYRSGSEVDAQIRIPITRVGLYRITQPALVTAGLSDAELIGKRLRLFNRDREVAIHVSTPGPMQASDYLLFYATGYDGSKPQCQMKRPRPLPTRKPGKNAPA